MASISVTRASIRPLSGAIVRRFDTGATVSVGNLVYLVSDGDVENCISDSATDFIKAWCRGIVVACPEGATSIGSGHAVDVVVYGPVEGSTGATPGTLFYANDTAGALDTAAGTVTAIGGFMESATIAFVRPQLVTMA